MKINLNKQFPELRKDTYLHLLQPSSGLIATIFFLYMVSCLSYLFVSRL